MDPSWEHTGGQLDICSWEMKTSLTTETETQIQIRTQCWSFASRHGLGSRHVALVPSSVPTVNCLEMDAHESLDGAFLRLEMKDFKSGQEQFSPHISHYHLLSILSH